MIFGKKADPDYQGPKEVYSLTGKFNKEPLFIPIFKKALLGSGDFSDVNMSPYGIEGQKAIFRYHNGIFSIYNVDQNGEVFIGKDQLDYGKMYVLKAGDSIKVSGLELKIDKKQIRDIDELDEIYSHSQIKVKEIDDLLSEYENDVEEDEVEEEDFDEDEIEEEDFEEDEVEEEDEVTEAELLGPLSRMLCLLSNLSVAYLLRYFVIPLIGLEEIFNSNINQILKIGNTVTEIGQSEALNFLIDFFLFYFIFSILCNLIFGVGLSQFILSGSGEGSFISKRIRAGARSILGFITAPFIIFDLPVLFKRKSLKEKIFRAPIIYKMKLVKHLGFFILLPLLVISSAILPLLFIPNFLKDGITTTTINMPKPKALEGVSQAIINSPLFQMKGVGSIPSNLIFLPHVPNKSTKDLGLIIINMDKKQLVRFTKKGTINAFKVVEGFKYANPLYAVSYPQLSLLNEKDNSPLFNDTLKNNYRALIESSLNLNLENSVNFIFKNGPFVISSIKARKGLVEQFGIETPTSIEFIKGQSNELMVAKKVSNRGKREILVSPLGPTKSPVYSIYYKSGSQALANLMIPALFTKTEWISPTTTYEFNPQNAIILHVLEFLSGKKDTNQNLPLPPQLASIFENTLKLAKGSGDKLIVSEVEKSLENLIILLERRRENPSPQTVQVIQLLKSLKEK